MTKRKCYAIIIKLSHGARVNGEREEEKADREIEALANLFIKNSLDKSSEM